MPMDASSAFGALAIKGLFLFAGAILVLFSIQKFLLLQKMRDTPLSKIRSAAIGLVEVFGIPLRPKNLRSPISGEKCIYWHITAQYNLPVSAEDLCDIESGPFTIKDATGAISIDARGADIDGLRYMEYEADLDAENQDWKISEEDALKVRKFIDRLDPGLKSEFNARRKSIIWIQEEWIPPSKSLYVLGNAEPRSEKSGGIADESLIIRKKGAMFISPMRESGILKRKSRAALAQAFIGIAISCVSFYLILI